MQSPMMTPMTPAFGPANAGAMMTRTQNFGGGELPQGFQNYPPLSTVIPHSYTDAPTSHLSNPYGTMTRPALEINSLRAERPSTYSTLPETITIPADYVRVISSQVRPMQTQENFVPIYSKQDQKHSNQMSARVRYQGPTFKSPLPTSQMSAPSRIPSTTVLHVGASAPLPLTAASAASQNERIKQLKFHSVCSL